MKFGSQTCYFSELFAIKDPYYVEPTFGVIDANPFGFTGTEITDDLAGELSSVTTQKTTTWGIAYPFVSVDLSKYSEIKFWAKGSSTGAWFEQTCNGNEFVADHPTEWREYRFVKNSAGTWDLYYNGELKLEAQTLTNLADDFVMEFGSQTCYFSELFGLPA